MCPERLVSGGSAPRSRQGRREVEVEKRFHVFYETGTRLSGTFLALYRKAETAGDEEATVFWDQEVFRVQRERRRADPLSRGAVIEALERFSHELDLIRHVRRTEAPTR